MKNLGFYLWTFAVTVSIMFQIILNDKASVRISKLEAAAKIIQPVDTLEMIKTEWHRVKFSLMESALYAAGKTNHAVRGYCYAMQAQDSIYRELINNYLYRHAGGNGR